MSNLTSIGLALPDINLARGKNVVLAGQLPETGIRGFIMGWYSKLKIYWRRRNRVKTVTRAVQAYSHRHFPGTTPDWSMIAEDRPEECVVYQTYRLPDLPTAPLPHRYFLVKLEDLSVTPLDESYRPEKWGPFL